MSKVMCPNIECVNYSTSGCMAKIVRLSETHCNTVNMGYQQFWKCKEYKMHDTFKAALDELEDFM